MNKLILLIFLLLFLTDCTRYIEVPAIETVTETVTETITEYIEIEDTDKIDKLENELQQYQDLIGNLNELLGYVYYMDCTNPIGGVGDGVAFSIEYNQDIYVISSGHIVENENGLFGNFRISLDNRWEHLELLDYSNSYMTKNDYAILVSNEIDGGFKIDLDNDKPLFLVSSDVLVSDYKRIILKGESGSPVIDIDGEVTEIATTDRYSYNTDIDTILEAIDNLN